MNNILSYKKSVALLLGLQLWSSTPIAAIYHLEDIDTSKYQIRYNNLPAVEDSDHQLSLRSAQFSKFLEDASEVVSRYEMEPYVGLRLIHRHFQVGKDQIMVEESQPFSGIPSLLTYAQDFEVAQYKGALPASWIVPSSQYESPYAFEASTDTAVRDGQRALEQSPEFIEEMAGLLRENQFADLLSIALLKRDSLPAKEGEMYLEINQEKPDLSVVQIWQQDQKPKATIRTSWSFKGPKQQGCLQVSGCLPIGDAHIYGTYHQHF